MTIEKFIRSAIEGGWRPSQYIKLDTPEQIGGVVKFLSKYELEKVLLDPNVWRAVGKSMGWMFERESSKFPDRRPYWHVLMLGMIDALAEGKTISQYLETL